MDFSAANTELWNPIIQIGIIAALILLFTASLSPAANEADKEGTLEAAIADAMEIGTLIKTLYFPEKTPHHTSISFTV